ncbi:MAG: cytochrome b/b6 domain-containing protein [Congregibacter sp.]
MNKASHSTPAHPLWDWPVRLIHWLVAALLPAMWWTAEQGYLDVHAWMGKTLFVAVVTRLLWGFWGSPQARFSDFLRGPGAVLRYLKSGDSPTPGHNPAGAWSAMLLWGLLIAQALTGMVNGDDVLFTGPLHYVFDSEATDKLSALHEPLFKILLGFVALHVLAIVYHERKKNERLLRPMIAGNAPDRAGTGPAQPLYKAIVLAAIVAGLLWLGISQAPAPPPSYW